MVRTRRIPSSTPLLQRALLACALVALTLLARGGGGVDPSSSRSSGAAVGPLLLVQSAKLPDCCCELETIEMANDGDLHEKLQKIRTFTFFRIFKVNLHSTCPFWPDNAKCSRRNCAVCDECPNDSIPPSFRSESNRPDSSSSFPGSLDRVDRTMTRGFAGWEDRDECQWIARDDHPADMVYINMALNPHGYTGYEGEEAHRIWRAIYQENCFNAAVTAIANGEKMPDSSTTAATSSAAHSARSDPNRTGGAFAAAPSPSAGGVMQPASTGANAGAAGASGSLSPPTTGVVAAADFSNMCLEQRVFYRLVSGLHASVSCHIAAAYPVGTVDPNVDLHAEENCALVGPNLDVFNERVGRHPDRLTNLYFTFVFMLRAVNKASGLLRSYNYSTGNPVEDGELTALVHSALDSNLVRSCSSAASFDEMSMFASHRGPHLKKQLRAAFRNISRIMDCVGCESCKLYGKLQILGMGTALKLLFEPQAEEMAPLERNEVMALVVTLAKFSNAIRIVHDMQERERTEAGGLGNMLERPGVLVPLALALLLVAGSVAVQSARLLKRRGRRPSIAGGTGGADGGAAGGSRSLSRRCSDADLAAAAAATATLATQVHLPDGK